MTDPPTTSRTIRPHWAMHELGLSYETRPIQPRTGETKTAEAACARLADPEGAGREPVLSVPPRGLLAPLAAS